MIVVIETNNWCGIINFNFKILIYYWIQKILLLFISKLNYGWIRCCIRLMTSMSNKIYCLFVCLFVCFFSFFEFDKPFNTNHYDGVTNTTWSKWSLKFHFFIYNVYHPTTTSCDNINYYHKIYNHIFLSIAYYNYYIIK